LGTYFGQFTQKISLALVSTSRSPATPTSVSVLSKSLMATRLTSSPLAAS
jgi:hypothetical protein